MKHNALYGHMTVRPECHGTITTTWMPETRLQRFTRYARYALIAAPVLAVMFILAAANPEVFAASFGASFGVAIVMGLMP